MAKKISSKKSAAKKTAGSKKTAAKKAPQAAKKVAAKKGPAGGQHPSDAAVLACIAAQAGGAIITPQATLGGLGVDGFVLAGCINSKLGSQFKGSDFPPAMTVAQCVLFVRSRT